MKIGILTYHRAHNYGALLQAIALRKVLSEAGHQVSYIDYWPNYHKQKYKLLSLGKLKRKKWKYIKDIIFLLPEQLNRINVFKKEIKTFIEPYCSNESTYDVIIYGSDQIWRKQTEIRNYNLVYFGVNDYNAHIHISYAASMGILHREDFPHLNKYWHKYSALGVREEDLQEAIVKQGLKCDLNLDPTMLLTSTDWDTLLSTKQIIDGPYVLFYNLNKGAFSEAAIQRFAMDRNLRIIELCGDACKETKSKFTCATLTEFVSLIKYADTVFASSFHGLVFSLIYHKRVFVSNISNTMRLKLLSSRLGIPEVFISPGIKHIPIYSEIDYELVDDKISALRNCSLRFLHDALSNISNG